ncbi:uncharacterized protein LOC123503369 isoform X4 [Portunus trituberculatus]|uniref:uncharacterized protein LOC123503369 isoform X4 n=1 Tax=Portunus trituberculatus TaxID=210409 RepID=UPI001E1CE711|nr:uncharacterized protein LOC123503369 isoform X4 [Portunus trituberculatus]
MADLSEHKDGGDDGKPDTAIALAEGSSELQCTSSGVCGDDPHQSKRSTLLSSELHQNECGSVSVHSVEAKGAKSYEEAAGNPRKLVLEDGNEAQKDFKIQDETVCGFDESKLAKTNVSQAKDPPDKENDQGEGKLLASEQNEAPPQEDASNEIQSVSTKPSETTVSLNNSNSEHPSPCTLPMSEATHTRDILKEANSSTETLVPSTLGCQESLTSLSKPSLSTVKSPELNLDLSSFVSSDHQQEKLMEAVVESQDSSKSSLQFECVEPTGVEGSSTQSSSISSLSDLCSASEVKHTIIDAVSQSYSVTSSATQISSVQQELGNDVVQLVNQSEDKKTEPHSQTSKTQCPQESISAENKRQDRDSGEKDGAIIEQAKHCMENEVPDNSEILTGQSEMNVEQNESCNDVSLTSETGMGTLPLIVATHSLSQEQDTEMSEKRVQTPLESTEMDATNKKIVPLLESEPLKPVTIGSSLQPLELIQEASMVEDTPITTDIAIIDSSADEADSIGGLVINNVIGAADGVVDFHPDDAETEKELTDISASAPLLGEGSDSSDEHGPCAKRRRLENGPNGVEDKSNSANRVIFKVIPVKNGHGVWNSQKLQEVLLAKGTILLQIHASKESMELFEAEKDEKKVDFTAIMAETKDDDHDQISFVTVEPEGDDPLAVSASHPSFSRPLPHTHRLSTALQPAISRPAFKHLQTPQEFHMKNEVLGLPPPLEFEEPQMGNTDWSGKMSRRRRLRDEEIPCQLVEIPSDPESDISDGDDDDDAAFLQEEEVAEYESCDENGDADDDEEEEEEEEEFRNQNPSPDVNCSSSGKIMWRKMYCPAPAGEFTSSTGPSQEIFDLEDPTPHDICSKFITKEVIEDIVFQTNLYALQQGKNYKPTDENEIKTFIGMNLLMGIVKLPSYRDYWSSNPCLHNDFISKLMPVNRFGWLLGNIHLNDNTLMPDRKSPEYDKLYKVCPFLKAMQENFERHFLPSCSVAVDESMIKFKGRSSMKQYQPNKPIKRGYKVWMMADKSGYCLKFDIYTGKVENEVTKDLGAKVVTSLVEDLEGKEHKVYFDNYFTSVDLMKKLKEKGVNACGTVKPSRRNLPTFKSSKNMSRGDSETFTSNTGINATKWRDKKDVFLLTNFHDPKDENLGSSKKRKRWYKKIVPLSYIYH